MTSTLTYQLKKFDMRWIKPNKRCIFIGKTETGKSTLLTDLLYYHRDIPKGLVISGTQDGIEDYSKIIHPLFIYDEYNKKIISDLISAQRQDKKNGIKESCFLILDDCLYDDKWTKDKEMKYIFFNSRHDRVFFLLTMQYPLGIAPALRANIDFVFILRENIVSNREKIWKHYAGMFPDFNTFCSVMNQCTENYQCLVIHNASKSNKFEDQVFWYKAKIHEPFKIGNDYYWITMNKAYNSRYDEKDLEMDVDFMKHRYGGSRKGPRIIVEKL